MGIFHSFIVFLVKNQMKQIFWMHCFIYQDLKDTYFPKWSVDIWNKIDESVGYYGNWNKPIIKKQNTRRPFICHIYNR